MAGPRHPEGTRQVSNGEYPVAFAPCRDEFGQPPEVEGGMFWL